MNEGLIILLVILAVYRVARMLALEEGPFGIFAEIRSHIDPQQATWLGRGMNCPLCLGFWLSFIAVLIFLPREYLQSVVDFIWYWLAIAGGMTALYELADRGE